MHRFCWVDLNTLDETGARSFYGNLFGWTVRPSVGAMGREYHALLHQDRQVGGLFSMPPEMRSRQMPPHWTGYVRVENTEATADRVGELGGTVVCVMPAGEGTMSIVKDPLGASLALWDGGAERDAELREVPHAHAWQELLTADPAAAREFYRGLFGWTARPEQFGPLAYTTFRHGETSVAGMLAMPANLNARSHWNSYFAVSDCQVTIDRARELGGQLLGGPHDIPGVGRTAILQDPQGAIFCVIRPAQ